MGVSSPAVGKILRKYFARFVKFQSQLYVSMEHAVFYDVQGVSKKASKPCEMGAMVAMVATITPMGVVVRRAYSYWMFAHAVCRRATYEAQDVLYAESSCTKFVT